MFPNLAAGGCSVRCEEGNFFQQPLCIERTGRDDNDGFGLLCQLGERERIAGTIEMAISNRGARGRDGQLERHRLRYDRKCAANPRVWGGTLKKIDIICQYPHEIMGRKTFCVPVKRQTRRLMSAYISAGDQWSTMNCRVELPLNSFTCNR